MTEETDRRSAELIGLTAEIVAAYVQNNSIPSANLPDLIASVYLSISRLGPPAIVERPVQTPAVNPKRSVFPDYIVSLEDGRKFKSMKRHLSLLGMTPDEYRQKWNLPPDYPIVSADYAAQRSALAKAAGLGRKAGPVKAPSKRKPRA